MPTRPRAAPPKSAQERMRIRRERLRARGLGPVQFWVPDLRNPRMRAAIRKEAALLSAHPENARLDAWIETLYDSLLHPAALLAAVPAVLNGLSGHPEQSQLDLHYGVLPLALSVVAAAFALGDIAAGRRWGRIPGRRWSGLRMPAANSVLVIAAASSFLVASPFSPLAERGTPGEAHRRSLAEAIEQIPDDASLSAQGTLLPHLSQRREVWEFPDIRDSDYIIVDAALPITIQSRAAGYDSVLRALPARGYWTIWVFRREFEE